MGNVPAKEGRSRSGTHSSGTSTLNADSPGGRPGRRNTVSSVFSTNLIDNKKSKRQEEKDKRKEIHYLDLIVRFNENVDGGFLAPYGTYKSNLDYDTEIVRRLIINRQLAPFYTPLQDFDDHWSDEELIILLSQMSLHSIETAYSDTEEDDMDDHKIHKSSNFFRRQEQKAKLISLITRIKDMQKAEENRFLEEKLKAKNGEVAVSPDIPSKDLLLKLYRKASECPICFLYYPPHLNLSRCCLQPICTECFVQIKRLDPHPPHDDSSNEPGSDALPHTLISESANCPYCAMPDFGVTYNIPTDICTGINGNKPNSYTLPFESIPEDTNAISTSPGGNKNNDLPAVKPAKQRRRSSVAADSPGLITIDMIRPDWEQKLMSARNKLARKCATASAIHASNLLINQDEENNSSRRYSSGENGRRSSTSHYRSVEERMIEEALRLSIQDEEERKKKAELDEQKKKLESK